MVHTHLTHLITHTHTHTSRTSSHTGNSNTSIIFISAVIVLVIAVIRLGMELFQFLRLINALEYLKDIVNWIEVILFVCSILFAFVFFNNCLCPQTWQWEVGVVAVFLAWIDLIIFLRKIPLTGANSAAIFVPSAVYSVDYFLSLSLSLTHSPSSLSAIIVT